MSQPVTPPPVTCPNCSSAQIHAEKRGWRLLTGFIGSGAIVITCLSCGHQFRPGAKLHGGVRESSSGTTILVLVIFVGAAVALWAIWTKT